MMENASQIFLTSIIHGMIVLGALTLIEMALPIESYSLRSRMKGLFFWVLTWLCAAAVAVALGPLWQRLEVAPLLTLEVGKWFGWAGPLAGVLLSVTVVLITDFFGYWFHRLQHGPLWRFHAVHHSIEEMHAVNSYGFAGDSLFQFVLMTIPMSLIPFGPYDAPVYLTAFFMFQSVFLHCPTRLHYGPLGLVLSDNRYHRIHHSLEPRHFHKNYGTMTTIWDRVFGTAYFPDKGEWPATGLAEIPQPRSIREYLDLPLRMGKREVAASASS